MSNKNRSLLVLAVILVAVFALSACAPKAPALGSADNPIIISFVPSADAATVLASASAITDVLSQKTGLTIEARVPTSFVGAIEAMCSGEAQGGALNTFSYVVASQRNCAKVALASVRFGSTTYAGQIIARADSGITSIADLKGHSFCRPDEFSTSGWIIPSITMKANGVDPATDLTEVIDAGGHPGVVRAVYNGDCDAGATFIDARTNVAEELPDVMDKVVVVTTTGDIPNDSIAFIPSLPQDTVDKITNAFLEMTTEEANMQMLKDLYSWDGLEKVDDSFYDPFRQTLQAAGVDVNTFISQ
jgi:phosphonate transport system substrate-binding protein